jgi:carbonic anhydrase/acetyltransferase-like protein (isoleucine patch superfamily)
MIDKIGINLEGETAYIEKLQPATRLIPHKLQNPKIAPSSFVAPTASVIGNVEIGDGSSIWYGAVVRGDIHYVKIGSQTSIGDGTVIHVAKFAGDLPAIIGNNVNVGPKSVIHACVLEDGCTIGAGSTVLDGARVSKGAILAPGSLAPPRCLIPEGQVWAGTPAVYLREVTKEESADLSITLSETLKLGPVHSAECRKTTQTLELESLEKEDAYQRDPDFHPTPQKQFGELLDADDVQGLGPPGMLFNNPLRHDEAEMTTYVGGGEPVEAMNRAKEIRSQKLKDQARLTE